jgi:glycosyltransferase involved in cell wall biosynthesis
MRILHLSSGRGFGGGERHVRELTRGLADRGHLVHVGARDGGELWRRLATEKTVRRHATPLRNALDAFSVAKLIRIIRRERIDVLHAHYARDYPLAAAAVRWLRLTRGVAPALFFTRHHYLPLSKNRWYRRWLAVADGAVAVSRSVQETLCDSLAWPAARIAVIPNWVDAAAFAPKDDAASVRARFSLPRDGFFVGVVNQLAPAKGQMEILDAAALLFHEFPQLHIAFAGAEAGGDAFTRELRARAAEIGRPQNVHFLGFVKDVPPLLAACDAVAVPSWNEGFSIGVLEAWAANVPVIASNVGGLAELIEHEKTGWLARPKSPAEFAAGLRRLMTDAALRAQLRAAGRETVTTRYTLAAALDQTEELYRAALARRRK